MADIRGTALLDDFNRADEDPLSGGGNWLQTDTAFVGPLILRGMAATHRSPGVSGDSFWTPQTFDPAVGQVEVWGCPGGGGAGAAGVAWALDFWQDAGGSGQVDGYRFRNESSGGGAGFVIYKVTNTNNVAAVSGDPGFVTGAGDATPMLMRRNGNDIEGWYSTDSGANWTMVVSMTDTSYMGPYNLACGIRDNSGGQVLDWDCFGGGIPMERKTQIYRWVSN